ncbi:MAG: class I SAM-dependent methyltransferase, partial [Candidatus Methylomirabilis sp.]
MTVDSRGLEQRLRTNVIDRVPVPPDDLAGRVGSQLGDEFLEVGMRAKQCIVRALNARRSSTRGRLRNARGWRWGAGASDPRVSFRRTRVLDFGCGAGRLMRHFVEEANRCEFWGCDIHRPSIEWLERHLVPPFRVVVSQQDPPLPFAEEYFDLVLVLSVFTHLSDSWEPWLVELRRIIRPGGLA